MAGVPSGQLFFLPLLTLAIDDIPNIAEGPAVAGNYTSSGVLSVACVVSVDSPLLQCITGGVHSFTSVLSREVASWKYWHRRDEKYGSCSQRCSDFLSF